MTETDLFPAARAQALNAALTTQRLRCEPLVAAHADLLFPALADPRIYRYIDVAKLPEHQHERARWAALECRVSSDGTQALLNWTFRRHTDGVAVGRCDVEVDVRMHAINVGFVLLPAYWGQGYATEGVGAIVASLARQGVRSFRATVSSPNVTSARVVTKLGFVAVGMSTEEHDTVVYERGGAAAAEQ